MAAVHIEVLPQLTELSLFQVDLRRLDIGCLDALAKLSAAIRNHGVPVVVSLVLNVLRSIALGGHGRWC